jgi:hypothetical protein
VKDNVLKMFLKREIFKRVRNFHHIFVEFIVIGFVGNEHFVSKYKIFVVNEITLSSKKANKVIQISLLPLKNNSC